MTHRTGRPIRLWSDEYLRRRMNEAVANDTPAEWRAELEREAERRNKIDAGEINGEYGPQ